MKKIIKHYPMTDRLIVRRACVEEFSIGKNGEIVNKMFFSELML
jgi:hypothetical protein